MLMVFTVLVLYANAKCTKGSKFKSWMNVVFYGFIITLLFMGDLSAFWFYKEGQFPIGFINLTIIVFCLFAIKPIISMPLMIVNLYSIRGLLIYLNVKYLSDNQLLMIGVNIEIISIIRYYIAKRSIDNKIEVDNVNKKMKSINKQLEELSLRDSLTGLLNRHSLRLNFNGYIGEKVFVVMMDVDDFKHYNDEYGHEVGDEVLKEFSIIIEDVFDNADIYRYGGDEFLLVSDCDVEDGIEGLKEIRNRFHGLRFTNHGKNATCSFGYVYGMCDNDYNMRKMINTADENLYKSKGEGKDRFYGEVKE